MVGGGLVPVFLLCRPRRRRFVVSQRCGGRRNLFESELFVTIQQLYLPIEQAAHRDLLPGPWQRVVLLEYLVEALLAPNGPVVAHRPGFLETEYLAQIELRVERLMEISLAVRGFGEFAVEHLDEAVVEQLVSLADRGNRPQSQFLHKSVLVDSMFALDPALGLG